MQLIIISRNSNTKRRLIIIYHPDFITSQIRCTSTKLTSICNGRTKYLSSIESIAGNFLFLQNSLKIVYLSFLKWTRLDSILFSLNLLIASNENRETIYDVVKETSKKCFVPLTVGGGVRSVNDINMLLNCGADKVSINTAAVQNPKVVIESSKKFGSQCIVVAIDAKKKNDKWEVYTHGGRNETGIDAIEFAKQMEDNGAGELLVTSMDRDGTQKGYDIDLVKKISEMVNIPVIASGGVGNLDHLAEGITNGKANAVLAASIFHYGKYSIKEAKQYLDSKGIPVRI